MNRQEYAIADHLPESLNRDNLREVAQVIDEKLHELDALNELVCLYPRIDKLSSNLIDALAIQFHVDFYDTSFSLEKRRALVKNSIKWHMRKGTKGAVQELIRTVWGSGIVREWFEYGGEPYHFKIDLLDADGITQNKYDSIIRLVETVKNIRSVLEGFDIRKTVSLDDESSIKYGLASLLLGCRRINPKPPDNTSLSVGYGFGDFSHGRQVINCGPVDISNHHLIRLGLAKAMNGVIRVECDTSEIPEEFRNILKPSVSGPYIGSGIFGHGYRQVRLQLPDESAMGVHSGTALFKNGSRRTGLSVPKETEASSRFGTYNIRMGRIRVPADVSEITMGSCRNAHAGIAHAGISQAGL
ncbi:phage tail protein I [Selenomonas sp. AE3005]|uniref:phage tail protein I n=1 Tax=Selenomonas sp. AE3005 TaxID=1485543 RepID=UPI0025F17DCD|nr:phage tail protein I [Selenomonas sp. AE3005]